MMGTMVLRRILLVIAAIASAAVLLRPQLSSALVTRGDMLAYWGHREKARGMYLRALLLDAGNGIAVDRYAFDAATSADKHVLQHCIDVTSRYLSNRRDDAGVLMDRALCYQHQRELAPAIADFRRAGEAALDPRAMMFAALDERALHQAAAARRLLLQAVSMDPHFLPARRALART